MKSTKLVQYMRYLFILLSFGAAVYNFQNSHWEIFWSSILSLIVFVIPSLFSKRSHLTIPPSLQIIILLFLFASMYLGEVHGYYARFHWWDTMLHSSSAMLLGYAGYLTIYALNRDKQVHMKLTPIFIALFSFCFAVAVGALWEIFEYVVDVVFNADMQKARNLHSGYGVCDTRLGVLDTMGDLIVDTCGALLVSVLGFFSLKRRKEENSTFWNIKEQFLEGNKDIFKD